MTERIYESAADIIGNTPLLRLGKLEQTEQISCRILAKLEYLNPGGSVKDRVALAMIRAAEDSGQLRPGGVIIEPTSGNTGIGLAAVAAARGYRLIVTMPDSMSMERRRLIAAYGAKVVLTKGADGMKGAIARAKELAREIPGSILAGQFVNPANPQAHRVGTGPEIWRDTCGKVDMLVAGVGTGGTVTGTGEYLKAQNPAIKIVAVEPAGSPVLSGGSPGAHKIQGIGAGFVPEILNREVIDQIIKITDEEAMGASRLMATAEGVLVGISAGAALAAALQLARKPENAGKTLVVIMPDGGERYLSTALYADEPV